MRDGLYGVVFTTPLSESSGVAHLTNGKVAGGGTTLYYFGTYTSEGADFSATITVEDYMDGADAVFNRQRMTIDLTGTFYGASVRFMGTSRCARLQPLCPITRLNTGSLFDSPIVPFAGRELAKPSVRAPCEIF